MVSVSGRYPNPNHPNMDLPNYHNTSLSPEEYDRRCCELEAQGLTRSDAQGCVDAQLMKVATSPQPVDAWTRKHTAFVDFEDLLHAQGGYWPSFYVRGKDAAEASEIRALAELYDTAQAKRGDCRRAFRGDF